MAISYSNEDGFALACDKHVFFLKSVLPKEQELIPEY
jgi:hypothetical protein